MTASYHLPEGTQTRIIELQGPPSMEGAIKATAPARGPMRFRDVSAAASQVLRPTQHAARVRIFRLYSPLQAACGMNMQLSLRAAAPPSDTPGG